MDIYPSKILLFGEYTIIKNSSALAIPYSRYQSHWSDERSEDPTFENIIDEEFSNESLQKIFNELKKLKKPKISLKKFKNQLDEGLWMCTNSPMGYGLGSSGAVSAAIYRRYVNNKSDDIKQLKQELSRIENIFHGKSSGIDPLISYTNSALWVHSDKSIEKVELPRTTTGGTIFLINSKMARNSASLINFFVEQCKDSEFIDSFVDPVSEAVEKAIPLLIAQDFEGLMKHVALISELQFMHLPPMTTLEMQDLWMRGIETTEFYLKLCGAGGGGFILGFTEDWEGIQGYLSGYEVEKLL